MEAVQLAVLVVPCKVLLPSHPDAFASPVDEVDLGVESGAPVLQSESSCLEGDETQATSASR